MDMSEWCVRFLEVYPLDNLLFIWVYSTLRCLQRNRLGNNSASLCELFIKTYFHMSNSISPFFKLFLNHKSCKGVS